MPVRKYLDISTAHITQEDAEQLDGRAGIVHRTHEYGAWVWVPDYNNDGLSGYINEQVKPAGFSEAFINLIRYARSLGCNWINLDCDAEVENGLPTFEW